VGAELSRGNVILLYFAGIGAIMLWRWLVIRLVVRASKTGQVAARRVLLVGERAAIEAFARRYQPWNLGFEIVGQAVLQSNGSLEPDLDRAALIGRALHPDDVFVILPWSDTETIERVVDRLMTLPVSIHLGPERILDRFAKVQIIKVSDMATLCLARPPLTFLDVVAVRHRRRGARPRAAAAILSPHRGPDPPRQPRAGGVPPAALRLQPEAVLDL
jgi:hypothetical protein